MKIVADENIPFIEHYFSTAGELTLLPGSAITKDQLKEADLLIVRSVTTVNAALLANTAVKWVGSVTAGTDHLDLEGLRKAKIGIGIAHGFNAQGVADYVVSVIAALQTTGKLSKEVNRMGIVGLGATGRAVESHMHHLDINTICCDPIRAQVEANFDSTPLSQLRDCDVITLHVPLTKQGEHATYQMIDEHFLERQQGGCILINASRGSVIKTDALLKHGQHLKWCFDVWENEPYINHTLLEKAVIATPHMAGYSLESKQRGVAMIYEAAIAAGWIKDDHKKPLSFLPLTLSNVDQLTWQEIVLRIFNPLVATARLKQSPTRFEAFRLTFNERREFSQTLLKLNHHPDKERLARLGFSSITRINGRERHNGVV